MQHSTWDLEIHAREMQQRRLREAGKARQIEAARFSCHQGALPGLKCRFTRLVSRTGSWLSVHRALTALPQGTIGKRDQVEVVRPSLPAEEVRLKTVAPSGPLSDPYAGMTVVARGVAARTSEQPCALSDC